MDILKNNFEIMQGALNGEPGVLCLVVTLVSFLPLSEKQGLFWLTVVMVSVRGQLTSLLLNLC